eukprot:3637331-Pyramimonas_sp.AAC.1
MPPTWTDPTPTDTARRVSGALVRVGRVAPRFFFFFSRGGWIRRGTTKSRLTSGWVGSARGGSLRDTRLLEPEKSRRVYGISPCFRVGGTSLPCNYERVAFVGGPALGGLGPRPCGGRW